MKNELQFSAISIDIPIDRGWGCKIFPLDFTMHQSAFIERVWTIYSMETIYHPKWLRLSMNEQVVANFSYFSPTALVTDLVILEVFDGKAIYRYKPCVPSLNLPMIRTLILQIF